MDDVCSTSSRGAYPSWIACRVNEKAPDGSTALMWATFNVDRELVRALLKAGAKADVITRYGASALGEAIKLEDLELTRTLLEAGANVNSPNLDKQTALMLAISTGNVPISKLLIERGADVNAVETFRNQNALMYAAGVNQRYRNPAMRPTVPAFAVCVHMMSALCCRNSR